MIKEYAGGGVTGGETTAVEWHVPAEPRTGWFVALRNWLWPTRCVASITVGGEWAEPGWEHVLPQLRRYVEKHV